MFYKKTALETGDLISILSFCVNLDKSWTNAYTDGGVLIMTTLWKQRRPPHSLLLAVHSAHVWPGRLVKGTEFTEHLLSGWYQAR